MTHSARRWSAIHLHMDGPRLHGPTEPPKSPVLEKLSRGSHQQGEGQDVGEDPWRHEEGSANQEARAIHERPVGQAPLADLGLDPNHRPGSLLPDQHQSQDPCEGHQEYGGHDAHPSPDLDEQCQLQERHDYEKASQAWDHGSDDLVAWETGSGFVRPGSRDRSSLPRVVLHLLPGLARISHHSTLVGMGSGRDSVLYS